MKNVPVRFLVATALLCTGLAAHAFTVDLDGTNATGIRNLDIGGTFYDVTFEFAQANTAPIACGSAVPCDAFFVSDDGSAAQAAVTAINAALNPTVAITVGSTAKTSYFVPYDKQAGTPENLPSWQGIFVANAWQALDAGGGLDGTDVIELARFSPAVVPVPPAAWLFGSALGVLGWIRRRIARASLDTTPY